MFAHGGVCTRWTTFVVCLLGFLAICVAQDDECVFLVDLNATPADGVCGTQGQECPTIHEAIEATESQNRTDCILRLLPGIYEGGLNVNITGDELSKWHKIESIEGSETTILDCGFHAETHAVKFGISSIGIANTDELPETKDFTVAGLTFRNCNGSVNSYGAVSSFQHNLRVEHSVFHDNTNLVLAPVAGGGIKSSKADYLEVSNCYFTRNAAGYGGGLLTSETKNVFIEDSYFNDNFGTKIVGGILLQYGESAYMKNVTLIDHVSIGPSALQILHFVHVEMEDVFVEDANAIPVPWGAMNSVSVDLFDNNNPDTTLIMRNVQVINSDGGQEGATLLGQFRDIEIIDCVFQGCSGETAAGAVKIYSTGDTEDKGLVSMKLRIENTLFHDNVVLGGYGGGLDIAYIGVDQVDAKIINSNFTNNIASDYGGAISVRSEEIDMKVDGCIFSHNMAMDFEGGAIFFEENAGGDVGLKVENSYFSNNTAIFGGAIFATIVEQADFEGNLFVDNYADEKGGSIFGSGLTFENDEFVNSRAGLYGGGAYAQRGEVEITSTKFTGCVAEFGGGLTVGARAILIAEDLMCEACHATADAACSGVSGYGGCVYFEEISCYISEVSGTFEGNVADTTGGVFFFEDGNCELCADDSCEFIENTAPYGVEAGSDFTEVRVDEGAKTVPIMPGEYFTVVLHAFDAFGNKLAGRHTLISAIVDFDSAKSSGLLIEGEGEILFLNGTAELTLRPFLYEGSQPSTNTKAEGDASKSSMGLTFHFNPVVEFLEVMLEFQGCGDNKELVPVFDGPHANEDPLVLSCTDVVVPTLGEQVGAWVVASLVLGILLFNAYALRYFKHYSQIQHGNRNALFLITIGLIIMQIGAYFAATSEYCAITVWFAGVGFSAASALLIFKNGQIALLFHFVYDRQLLNTRTSIIRPRYLYMTASFIVIIDMIILIVWTAADSPFYLRSDYQRFCVSDKASTYLTTFLVLKCIMAVCGLLLVYKLKKVPELFREVSATVLMIPIGLTAGGIAYWSYDVVIPAHQPLANSYIISVTVAILFVIIFMEKWFHVHQNRFKTLGEKSSQLNGQGSAMAGASRESMASDMSEQEELLKEMKKLEAHAGRLNKQLSEITTKHKDIKEQFFYTRLQADDELSVSRRSISQKKTRDGGFSTHSPSSQSGRGSQIDFAKDKSGVAASRGSTIELGQNEEKSASNV